MITAFTGGGTQMSGQEIELKLLVTPDGLKRLRRLAWLRTLQCGRAKTQSLRSVYFDTPDLELRAQRMTLRIRSVGRRRIQTLKTAGDAIGGAFARGEWESEIGGDSPDPKALAATPLAEVFDDALLAALRPVVATEIRRTEVMVAEADAEMAVAFDQGQLQADGRVAPLCELEVELKRGPPRAMFELALRLHACTPLRIGRASKAEKAFRLLQGESPAPEKWVGSPIAPGMTAAAAFQGIVHSCLDHLAANEESFLTGGGPEAVHQMRVALRRLRSAIALFKDMLDDAETAALKDELRWLLKRLGPARDTDVFIAEILDPVRAAFPDDGDLRALRLPFEARRDSYYREAEEALRSPRFTTILLTAGAWIAGGAWLRASGAEVRVEPLAARLLSLRDKKVRKAGRKLAKLAPEQRHAVRILLKKLRYAAEFFAPLYDDDKRKRRFLACLSDLQDRLGLLNDIAVAHRLLRESLDPSDPRLQWAAGLVAGWHEGHARRLLRKAAGEWDAFVALDRFWDHR